MLLSLRFFDKESWSFYATLNVVIPCVLFAIFKQKFNSQSLIFMSLLAMMQGTLLAKILVTGFLCFLIFEPTDKWVYRSILYIISILIIHYIPKNHLIHNLVINSDILKIPVIIVIFIWMMYILHPAVNFIF
jgi:hypothetical protein